MSSMSVATENGWQKSKALPDGSDCNTSACICRIELAGNQSLYLLRIAILDGPYRDISCCSDTWSCLVISNTYSLSWISVVR